MTIFIGWTEQPFQNYIDALERLGAVPERREPERCAALLLPGGGDIHPRFYAQALSGAEDIDEARDRYELRLFRQFVRAGKPVLGICRGMQLINTALGGTLLQHVAGHSRTGGFDRVHPVRCTGSLGARFGNGFSVNSAHHQAIDRLGRGLCVEARAEDGVIEAVRHETLPVFGVQWHPERLGCLGEAQLAAFLELVKQAS